MALEFIDKAPTLEEYKEMRRLVNFMPLSDRICRNLDLVSLHDRHGTDTITS